MPLFGAHLSIAGGCHRAAQVATRLDGGGQGSGLGVKEVILAETDLGLELVDAVKQVGLAQGGLFEQAAEANAFLRFGEVALEERTNRTEVIAERGKRRQRVHVPVLQVDQRRHDSSNHALRSATTSPRRRSSRHGLEAYPRKATPYNCRPFANRIAARRGMCSPPQRLSVTLLSR